ncbi:Trk system potassium transporter TrkA [Thermodesulforhabdus norvegica]|uniref:Trk system potassium uptake protein TrkA n=1 Tax=Thermodesulforhabdus norvegica TaxID=39841 RepID=A0A1I4SFR5_9BACT|nr:Trk system potassium transporter TrkA [Thermodesulforhabdus norvegica]SFM63326.1 trk system potassium uptake protein TrkA [Thermodesulforhabdus norvegica]
MNRIIIVGAGEVGYHIAKRLATENKEVVIIDRNPEALSRCENLLDVQPVLGSGNDPNVLMEAGIREADLFLAVTDSDETNIISSFFAGVLSPGVVKLARIRSDMYYGISRDILSRELKIDMIINPEEEAVKTVVRLLSVPDVEDVSEFAGGRVKLLGIRIDGCSPCIGRTVADIRAESGGLPFIIGVVFRDEHTLVPTGSDKIRENDLLYVACEQSVLRKVLAFFRCTPREVKNIMIIGGGHFGLKLAQTLEARNYSVKIVEKNAQRCDHLSSLLQRAVVIKGDGTDRDLLLEENIHHMDMVISATGDDGTNILCSLLAGKAGAARTITRVNRFAYIPMMSAVGLRNIVSSRLAAINTILQFVRRGRVVSAIALKGEDVEVLEVVAEPESGITGKPLKNIKFPRGVLILCLIRKDGAHIPTGDTVIEPGDRVVILSTRQSISAVERELMVKMRR